MAEPKKVELTYRLPLTTVTVDGTRTTVTNPYTKPKRAVTYTSHIATQIEADPEALYRLRLPDPDDSVTACTVEVAPDGRLISTQANVDDKSEERTRALLKFGVTAVAAIGSVVATALLAPAALPTVGALVVAGAGARLAQRAPEEQTTSNGQEGEATRALESLGIESDYRSADEPAAMLLGNLRRSAIILRTAIARAGIDHAGDPGSLAVRLKHLTKAQAAIQAELARAEADYAKWIAAQSTTRVESFHHVCPLDELPSTTELKRVAETGVCSPKLRDLLTQLQCAVSRDYEDEGLEKRNGEVQTASTASAEDVIYRVPRLATITHWAVKPVTRQGVRTWELTEVLRERHKVVVVRGNESRIPLRPTRKGRFGTEKPAGDSDTGLVFDADGLLTKVSTKRTDPSLERAATLAELPGHLEAGISAGKALLKPFTPEGRTNASRRRPS